MNFPLSATIFCALAANVFADPQITSWFTLDSGKFAQIYRTDAEKFLGRTETTWSNGRNTQSQPAYCGVQEILSSTNWIYVRSTGLGSQVMGPWQNGRFPNLPTDQHFIFTIPRHPRAGTARDFNRLGEIGMFVDGVRMFDAGDSFSYSNQNGRDADPRTGIGQGDNIWHRDALMNEGRTFDAALAHQQDRGTYHYHVEPIALRYLLGDHVDFDAATKTYREGSSTTVKHSPILGWLQDGYPIYGPYGFSNATNPAGGVRRMVSGFVLRNGENGADNLAQTGRRTLPAWNARENNRSAALQNFEAGPNVGARYPLGQYLEDYAYLGDLGKTLGGDFDLDEMNGRWCVTPEFPQGTYANFTTIDATGRPVYPYNMGRRFYGHANGRLIADIREPVTTNFVAHPVRTARATASETTTLVWRATDGGEYQKHQAPTSKLQ
jgi:YHYH protein